MHFSKLPKLVSQQVKRGWSDADIQQVLDNPVLTLPTIDYRRKGSVDEKATVYYRRDGHYVIRNDTIGEVFQLSNTYDLDWYDEHRGGKVSPLS